MADRLPPGLQGYVLAQEQARRGDASNIGNLGGILNIQGMLEQQRQAALLHPLQLAQLQAAIEDAQSTNAIRGHFMGLLGGASGPSAPSGGTQPTLGYGGMSKPGGGQENAITGQSLPPMPQGGALSSGGVPGLPGVQPAALLAALTGKDMSKVGTMIQEANKPIAAREGAPVINPATGQILFYAPKLESGMLPSFEGGRVTGVSNIPGYVPSMAERTQSQEGVKGGYSFQQVPVPGGGTQMMTTTDASRALSGGAPAAAAPAAGPRLSDIPYIPPAKQRQTQANMDAGLNPAGTGPAIPSSTVLGRTNPIAAAGATETAKGRAEGGVKFEQSVLDAGRAARGNLTNLQIIAPNLDKLPTGPLYPTLVTMKNYLNQFGLSVDPNLGPAQATGALLNQMALKVRDPAGGGGMPGAMSDADREFLIKTIPNLGNSPQGNRTLVKILMTLEQRKIDEAAIVNKMQAANYGTNEIRDALGQYANTNSLAGGLQ